MPGRAPTTLQDVDDVPERVLVDADKGLGVGRVDTSAAAAAHDAAAAAGRRCARGKHAADCDVMLGTAVADARRQARQLRLGHRITCCSASHFIPGRYPPGHPLAWLEEEAQAPLSEARRRELIELGFPGASCDTAVC